MLRKQKGKLYLSTIIVKDSDNIWHINANEVIEFNKISENNFMKDTQNNSDLAIKIMKNYY